METLQIVMIIVLALGFVTTCVFVWNHTSHAQTRLHHLEMMSRTHAQLISGILEVIKSQKDEPETVYTATFTPSREVTEWLHHKIVNGEVVTFCHPWNEMMFSFNGVIAGYEITGHDTKEPAVGKVTVMTSHPLGNDIKEIREAIRHTIEDRQNWDK